MPRCLCNRWVATAAGCAAVAVLLHADTPQKTAPPPSTASGATAQAQAKENRDAPELDGFKSKLRDYVALHKKIEATLPALPKDATPEQIDRNQRAFATLISSSRPGARQGAVFTAAGQTYVRALLARLFANADRAKLRDTILDENPGPVALKVDGRYPDQVPLASMPPEVLLALPALPEELEYRFVGDALILFDPHAHTVVDFVPNALPK